MNAIMHKQAFLQQALPKPRAAAEVAQGKPPSADRMDTTVLACDIGRACAQNGDDAVLIAQCALQGDHTVKFHIGVREGQPAFYRNACTFDITAGQTKNCVACRVMRLVHSRIVKSVVDRCDHIDEGSLWIGDNIGRAAAPRTQNRAIATSHNGTASCAAAINANEEFRHEDTSGLKIPKKYH